MFKTTKMRIILGLMVAMIVGMGAAISPWADTCLAGNCKEKANGHGTLVFSDGTRRQFSFSAIRNEDGTAKGQAVIHNKAFDFKGNIDVACMEVVGNRARIAGIVKNTNDPAFDNNTAVFEVVDNGNPGRGNDTISTVYFSPPNTPPPTAAYCQAFENFPQLPVDNCNIQVDDCQ